MHFGSLTVIPVNATLPALVTVNVYGTTWSAAVIEVVVDDFATFIAGYCVIGMFNVSVSRASRPSPP